MRNFYCALFFCEAFAHDLRQAALGGLAVLGLHVDARCVHHVDDVVETDKVHAVRGEGVESLWRNYLLPVFVISVEDEGVGMMGEKRVAAPLISVTAFGK